jgi:hypothetical protein
LRLRDQSLDIFAFGIGINLVCHLDTTKSIALVLAFASSTASADVMFIGSNNPQPNEENILFSGGSGTTVAGLTNTSGSLVDFTSTTGQTLTSSCGQAKITTTDNGNLLTSIDVTAPDHFFTDLIVNPAHSGPFTVSVTTNDGTFTDSLAGGPGN